MSSREPPTNDSVMFTSKARESIGSRIIDDGGGPRNPLRAITSNAHPRATDLWEVPVPILFVPNARQGFYRRSGKRVFDIVATAVGLLLLAPLLLLVTLLLKLTSRGPVFYSQERVGKGGRLFRILKFRSMVLDADVKGPAVTSAGDPRITRLGQLLRRSKLDELPQLWNVLHGDMSLVGPRPEVPLYAAGYTAEQRQVLTVRPGITDIASIAYRNEEDLLGGRPDPEQYYREVVLPDKLALNAEYLNKTSLGFDLLLILKTTRSLFSSLNTANK